MLDRMNNTPAESTNRSHVGKPERTILSPRKPRPKHHTGAKKPELTGHEAFLAECIAEKRDVLVTSNDGQVRVKITDQDKFAVKVYHEDTGYSAWVFKHSIVALSIATESK